MTHPQWHPTCSRLALQLRATMLDSVRKFFCERDYLEVETPLLSTDVVVDAHLHPFTLRGENRTLYLQTSPEAGMKRLLAAGSGSIFQITRSFRRGESGERHNPEFTIIEWYGVESTHIEQMQLTEALVRSVMEHASTFLAQHAQFTQHAQNKQHGSMPCSDHWSAEPFLRVSYDDAFRAVFGINVLNATIPELLNACSVHGISVPHMSSGSHSGFGNDLKDEILNVMMGIAVEPELGLRHPTFIHSYPSTQAALARLDPRNPFTAHRFELYIQGLELCNGYYELTDTEELLQRDVFNNQRRSEQNHDVLPGAPLMMAAMRHGLPDCSGVALGFDRLVMLALGATSIHQVIPFPL
ncbi:MAG: EF-P lysine aminoacylase GenX [Planctomyces sp.]|nr:EF-P lysine aminoacylase GenX [Planctomyces sp.]